MKYIIDVPDNTKWLEYYQTDSSSNICFHGTAVGINELKPYTEPDRTQIEDEVWEFVRIITDMTERQRKECFGKSTCDLDEYLTYQEAKAKYEAWMADKKQKETSELEEVTALANRIGIHRLYSLVNEIRGE